MAEVAGTYLTRCQPWLGTFVEVTVPSDAAMAINDAFAAIAHVHARMAFHGVDSDLAALRRARAGDVVRVDPQTVTVLEKARALYRASDGLFDVAVGAALVAVGFLPGEGLDDLALYDGDTGDIEIVDAITVRPRRRMLIDLGGIAKGFAVDQAVAALMRAGVREGLVNAGGDLRAFGGGVWPIRLRGGDGGLRQTLTVTDEAVASSANRLNRQRHGDVEFSPHIGRGGRPVLAAHRVTVIAPDAMTADALTKIALADADAAARILPAYGARLAMPEALEAC